MPESRDRTKIDKQTDSRVVMLKPNGKPSQELVLTLLTLKSTMPVGKIDDQRLPDEGEVVRVILKGKAYGDWIDASKELDARPGVGYIVEMDTTVAQAYDENGTPTGPEMHTQAEADLVPRGRSLGYYGGLTIRVPVGADEVAWDTKACAFYNDSERPQVVDHDAHTQSTPEIDEF